MEVLVFFNFRSPYCYLATQTLFDEIGKRGAKLIWKPLAGWDGRSPKDRPRIKDKVRIARQDVQRIARKMDIPFCPPPPDTDPTLAALGSLYAEKSGQLAAYVKAVMQAEWAEGKDIGDEYVLMESVKKSDLNGEEFLISLKNRDLKNQLSKNWEEAQELGVIGVPSFVVEDQIFWGHDRLSYLLDYIEERAA